MDGTFHHAKELDNGNAPAPSDPRVKLKPIPAKQFAVIRFSGSAGDALIAEKTEELRRFVKKCKLATVGEPVFAFYNLP